MSKSKSLFNISRKAPKLFQENKDKNEGIDENKTFLNSETKNIREKISLKEKAIGRVKKILNKVISPKTNDIANKKDNKTLSVEEASTKNLKKLIKLALVHEEYLNTEGVLRLLTNEVERNKNLANMQSFFEKNINQVPSVNLLTVLIKSQFKLALTQNDKKNILLACGVSLSEIEKQSISDKRFNDINEKLHKNCLNISNMPDALFDMVLFSKELTKRNKINKMPPSAIAFSLAPCLLPELKKTQEYRVTLLRYEVQISTLLKSAFKIWIENAAKKTAS